MKKIEDLRQVTDHALYGLTADESLKFRILQKAAQPSGVHQKRVFHTVPVLCSLIALLLIAVVALNSIKPVVPSTPGEINVFAAGSKDTVEPEIYQEAVCDISDIPAASVSSIEISGLGRITDPDQCTLLVSILQEKAESADTDPAAGSVSLVIRTSEGAEYRFYANDPYLTGNKTWSCPDFFSSFKAYTGQ